MIITNTLLPSSVHVLAAAATTEQAEAGDPGKHAAGHTVSCSIC